MPSDFQLLHVVLREVPDHLPVHGQHFVSVDAPLPGYSINGLLAVLALLVPQVKTIFFKFACADRAFLVPSYFSSSSSVSSFLLLTSSPCRTLCWAACHGSCCGLLNGSGCQLLGGSSSCKCICSVRGPASGCSVHAHKRKSVHAYCSRQQFSCHHQISEPSGHAHPATQLPERFFITVFVRHQAGARKSRCARVRPTFTYS
jgi:hypothetical protein